VTPEQAVSRGVLTVNGSVMAVMFGIPALVFGLALLLGLDRDLAGGLAGLILVVCLPSAWLTWSLLVPRWRLWAYERVDDLDELKARGVEAGLIWREGHIFERTEFRTRDQRERLQALEQAWLAKRGA
jgi:hypothetical protein